MTDPHNRSLWRHWALGVNLLSWERIFVLAHVNDWEDAAGKAHLSFNDVLALADRRGAPKNIPLRVVGFRLGSTFEDALAP